MPSPALILISATIFWPRAYQVNYFWDARSKQRLGRNIIKKHFIKKLRKNKALVHSRATNNIAFSSLSLGIVPLGYFLELCGLKIELKASLLIPFTHAFSTLRCIFPVLILIETTNVITRKHNTKRLRKQDRTTWPKFSTTDTSKKYPNV